VAAAAVPERAPELRVLPVAHRVERRADKAAAEVLRLEPVAAAVELRLR